MGRDHIIAYSPDFDCSTQGKDLQEAVDMAGDMIYAMIEDRLDDGLKIPYPIDAADIEIAEDETIVILVTDVCEEYMEEERYTLTPKGIASLALVNAGFAKSVDDERIDAFWEDFNEMMERFGYTDDGKGESE